MSKTKIFFVTTELPAMTGGSPVRVLNLIKNLPKDKFSITLFSILDNKSIEFLPSAQKEMNVNICTVSHKDINSARKLYVSLFKRVIPYMEEYRESDIARILLNKINEEQPDIIQVETINAYYAIKHIVPIIKEKNIKIILDAHNVEQVAFKESLNDFNFLKKTIGKWILPNFSRIENIATQSVDCIFTCSDTDRKFFMNFVSTKKITVIPNGADTSYFRSEKQVNVNTIFFMGGANYPPNDEALKYFFTDIYPIVKKSIPDIELIILCGNTPLWLKRIADNDPSIILPGFVKDVREYLDKAKICISPIKSGSGTSLKVLEYMAMGKPVVSTSMGVRGLNVKKNDNILIANGFSDFAKKIIWLIKNPNEGKKIGDRSRKLIEEKYEWNIISRKAESVYRKLNYEIN